VKLSMSMIERFLSRYEQESTIQDDERTIRGMRFISEQQTEYAHDYVYIGKASEFFEDPRYADALILASGRNHVVCRGLDYEDLLNDVLAVFDFYGEAEQRLLDIASRHGLLQDMMTVIADMLPEPFVVFGIDGSVLASIGADRIPHAGLRDNIIVRKSLGADGIGGYFTDDEGVVHHDLGRDPLLMHDANGVDAVSLYVYRDDEPVGFAMCFPATRAGALLALALEPVCTPYLAQAEEFTSGYSPHQALHLAFAELIGGREVATEAIGRLEAALEDATSLQLVSVTSRVIGNRTQRMLLANEVEASGIPCISCEMGDAVVFAVGMQRIEDLLARIAELFDERSLSVGVSMPSAGFDNVQSACRQAEFARLSSSEPGIRRCRDLALPFLLDTLRADPVARDMAHPSLGVLTSYDRAHATELLPTLRTYVECGCNQVEAAKSLFVHLNTLKYRLGRIAEIANVDFKDREVLFHIELSFRME